MTETAVSSDPAPFADPAGGEPFLLTPGPLTTALSVKQAMLRDWGSWDSDFRAMTAQMRASLLAIAGDISGERELVVIGSQAILGQFPDAPVALLASMEADIYPLAHPEHSLSRRFHGPTSDRLRHASRTIPPPSRLAICAGV